MAFFGPFEPLQLEIKIQEPEPLQKKKVKSWSRQKYVAPVYFLQFYIYMYICSLWGKKQILPNLTNSQRLEL